MSCKCLSEDQTIQSFNCLENEFEDYRSLVKTIPKVTTISYLMRLILPLKI